MIKPVDEIPAFPVVIPGGFEIAYHGMSLRDWFAGQALAGINANPFWNDAEWPDIAAGAYQIADAMLAERAKAEGDK